MGIEITNTLQIIAAYFANSNLGDEDMYMVIMAAVIVPIIIVAPFLPMLINRFGKRKLTVYCSIIAIVLSIAQYFIGYDNLVIFLAVAAVRITFMQIPLMLYGMFTTDCIEYGAYITGERTAGISFALQTFMTKLGGALANTLCLVILAAFGYVEQAKTQSASALNGIWVIMCIVPAVGYVVMLIVMTFYKLEEKDVAMMMEENQKRH
jgi:Na+/melibiose symporter-like transporter